MSKADPRLLNVAEVAERLGVSERFVRRLVHERRIDFLKVGYFVRFLEADVDAYLERSRVPAEPVTTQGGVGDA
jgi:excisionase family DNA binding protein